MILLLLLLPPVRLLRLVLILLLEKVYNIYTRVVTLLFKVEMLMIISEV